MATFVLGFVADPIINMYLDPYTTISSIPSSKGAINPMLEVDEDSSWTEHFAKGLASLGLLGFVKVLLSLSPWQYWNMRNSGLMTGTARAGTTGRDRMANISWIVVLVGVGTFLYVSFNFLILHLMLTCGLGSLEDRAFMEQAGIGESRGTSHGRPR